MKSILIALFLLGTAITVKSQVKEVSGFQNPESVIAYKDKLYVTNMGAVLDPTAKDGDGYISMLSRKDGKMIEEKFITGLHSPKGMRVHCKKLTVADVDKIVVYSLKTKEKIKEIDLSPQGVMYANDLAKKHGGVYVSATLKNAIYKVCTKKGKVKQLDVKAELPGANGLFRKHRKIFVANYGRDNEPNGNFGKTKKCGKKYKVYQSNGIYDGIVKVGHKLVVTDWVSPTENKGRIITYDLCKKKAGEVNIGRTIDGPADIYADRKNKVLWVPAMRENKILAVPFDMIKK